MWMHAGMYDDPSHTIWIKDYLHCTVYCNNPAVAKETDLNAADPNIRL